MWPLGSATTLRPLAARRTGTMTIVSSPLTTTPPAENSRLRGSRRSSVDIPPEGDRVVDRQSPAALRDHPGALERGQETAGRLAAPAGGPCPVRPGGGQQDVAVAGALGAGLVDELGDHGGHAALHRLEALAGEALVGRAQ